MTRANLPNEVPPRASRRVRRLLVAAAIVAFLAVLADCGAVHYLTTAPNADETPPTTPHEGEAFFHATTLPPEQIAYEIISAPSPTHTVFVLHGMRDSRGSMVPWARALVDVGARAILVDARGHGRSTGKVFSYGVRESLDLVGLLDALSAQGVVVGKIGVLGFSVGAGTAIMWAGRDSRVAAVVAVAPIATMDFLRDRLPIALPDFVVHGIVGQVGRRSGFDPREAGGLAWIEKTHAPVLFVHGAKDRSVDPEASRVLFARAPPGSELVIVPDHTHASMLRDAESIGRTRATPWLTDHLR